MIGAGKRHGGVTETVRRALQTLTPEQALALAVAKGALGEERCPFVTDSADPRYVTMRRYVSPWESS